MSIFQGTELGDLFFGTDANDFIYGGPGDDILYGEGGDDLIFGGLGDDTLFGGAGRDVLFGGEGDDALFGGDDADMLFGGAGDDQLFGDLGHDVLFGGDGADLVDGGDGNDILFGGAGDDIIVGGTGNDLIWAGAGADLLVFSFQLAATEATVAAAPDLDGLRQHQFVKSYKAFLADNGIDLGGGEWTWNANDASGPLRFMGEAVGEAVAVEVSAGRSAQTRWIATDLPVDAGFAVVASDGHDVVFDADDLDTFLFAGLAGTEPAVLDDLFDIAVRRVDFNRSLDTVLSWDGGSLTLLGWSEASDVASFFADDQMLLV